MEKFVDLAWGTPQRRLVTALIGVVLLFAIVGTLLAQSAASNWSEEKITELIEDRFQSEVEIGDLQVTVFPMPTATGREIRFFHKGRRDVPPMISLDGFSIRAAFWDVLRSPMRIADVQLEGLLIQIPPDDDKEATGEESRKNDPAGTPGKSPVVVAEIRADGAELRILPRESYKEPQVYEMSRLRLWTVSASEPMAFETTMTNAKPPGDIQSEGRFGPWHGDDPGRSPVSGEYVFTNADLGVFNGISGILSSTGTYEGVLERLRVEGETDVPDFTVKASGHPVHLKTKYTAIVDGTSGDTFLEPVEASFLDTSFTANGGVYQKPGTDGKTVELDVDISNARIEDLLRLAVKGEPMPLTGSAQVKTHFELPPGEEEIPRRLNLKGDFDIGSAKFPNWEIQKKVEGLSNRASGNPEASAEGDVVSDLSGSFVMDSGTVNLSNLSFRVPSAEVALDGSYGILNESLDFRGTLTMDAKVSEATTGFKSFLAKIIDPFFSKDHAGSVIPIKVTGTRKDPKFGLALGGGK